MEDLREPGPDDVVAAAEASHDLLSPLADKDWSVIAGDLEWDCRQTLEHVAFVQLFYATSAADPSQRRLPTARINNSDRSIGELVNVHLALSNVLAAVLRSDVRGRAWHPPRRARRSLRLRRDGLHGDARAYVGHRARSRRRLHPA